MLCARRIRLLKKDCENGTYVVEPVEVIPDRFERSVRLFKVGGRQVRVLPQSIDDLLEHLVEPHREIHEELIIPQFRVRPAAAFDVTQIGEIRIVREERVPDFLP